MSRGWLPYGDHGHDTTGVQGHEGEPEVKYVIKVITNTRKIIISLIDSLYL